MRHEAHASGPGPGDPKPLRSGTEPALRSGAEPAGGVAAAAGGVAAAARKPSPAPEWAIQALDKVDEIVDKVRAGTTERLGRLARVVVFGLLALIMATTAGVLAVIALIRGLDELIPGSVWIVYVILGAIFTGAGAFLWSKKTAPLTSS